MSCFRYLSKCFWFCVAAAGFSLLNTQDYGIVFGLLSISFSILLNGVMRDL